LGTYIGNMVIYNRPLGGVRFHMQHIKRTGMTWIISISQQK